MAGLFDKSRSECALALSKVAKAYKNTIPSRKHPELVLFLLGPAASFFLGLLVNTLHSFAVAC